MSNDKDKNKNKDQKQPTEKKTPKHSDEKPGNPSKPNKEEHSKKKK